MPFTDIKGASRLIERIDQIVALVRSWSGSHEHNGSPTVRSMPAEDRPRFEELDARIGALMNALGFSFPPSLLSPSKHRFIHGYTQIELMQGYRVNYPDEWERRIIAVKHAAQELLDVANSNESDARLPDTIAVRELCALLAKKAGSGRPIIQIARDYTGEKPKNDRRAKSLLRQAQRFRHLWAGADN